MPPLRFAIWTAVSTPEQAKKGKGSLLEQETASRKAAATKGWKDTRLHYSVPGASRTRYVNLSDAERRIPQLHQMLEDAKHGRFDLLIMWDYNRLRDLLDPVAKSLAQYRVQIYSVNQPIEPIPPEDLAEYTTDSEFMMRSMNRMVSYWQIADLRRKYNYGTRLRLERGLNPIGIPYGYTRPNKDAVPTPHPLHSKVVLEIKDRFLRGESYDKIIAALDAKYPTPSGKKHWSYTTVRKILTDPYYAGKVIFRRRLTQRDARQDKKRIIKNPTPLINDGAHKPLYSWEVHLKILHEMEIRASSPAATFYPYSGILYCSECRRRLRRVDADGYVCKGCFSVRIRDHDLMINIPAALQIALPKMGIKKKKTAAHEDSAQPLLDELDRQRKRIQHGFEEGLYTAAEAKAKLDDLDRRIANARDEEHQHARQRLEAEEFQLSLQQARAILPHLPHWFATEDPKTVNTFLHRLCTHIYITPAKEAIPHFRTP